MWLDLINLALMLAFATYAVGAVIRLAWMLLVRRTPRYQGLPRAYRLSEYLSEPLGWPAAVLWWVLMRQSRRAK
jgi:hypothetical protein